MDAEDQFRSLVLTLEKTTETLGLHLKQAIVVPQLSDEYAREVVEEGPKAIEELFSSSLDILNEAKKGNVIFNLMASFQTADLAWDDRTLHPDRFAINTQAAALLPSKEEMLSEEIRRQVASGVALEDVVIPEEYR